MSYSFKEIGDTIYEKCLEIKDTRLGQVYNHDIKLEGGVNLPAVVITPTNGSIYLLDSCNYDNSINFRVRVIDRIQDGIANTENNIRILADEVLSKLKEMKDIQRDTTPGNTYSLTFDYDRGYADTIEPYRVFDITLHFKAISK